MADLTSLWSPVAATPTPDDQWGEASADADAADADMPDAGADTAAATPDATAEAASTETAADSPAADTDAHATAPAPPPPASVPSPADTPALGSASAQPAEIAETAESARGTTNVAEAAERPPPPRLRAPSERRAPLRQPRALPPTPSVVTPAGSAPRRGAASNTPTRVVTRRHSSALAGRNKQGAAR